MAGKIDEFDDFHPLSRAEWRAWLEENHDKSAGVWFVYYKKAAGKPRVTYDEAVEEALCFGWIDSVPRKLDSESSKLLFTPRKPKSVWSKPNKERIEKLLAKDLMTEAGWKKIEGAKLDGSWEALDASDNLTIEKDLAAAFARNETAKANFDNFTEAVKRTILSWIYAAKTDETRARRIDKTVQSAAENKRALFEE
jgi:uncharacterized protein YdeI (YjbR/CyaY-like superfamily)